MISWIRATRPPRTTSAVPFTIATAIPWNWSETVISGTASAAGMAARPIPRYMTATKPAMNTSQATASARAAAPCPRARSDAPRSACARYSSSTAGIAPLIRSSLPAAGSTTVASRLCAVRSQREARSSARTECSRARAEA